MSTNTLLLVQISGHCPNVVTTLINMWIVKSLPKNPREEMKTQMATSSLLQTQRRDFLFPIDFAFAMVDVEAFILGFSNTV